jgi:hypothetical protein
MDDLRYPIGRFTPPVAVTSAWIAEEIGAIERLPADLRRVVTRLSPQQLDTPYRPGGWTVRQVVHHLADSHVNSYVRFRWALTEDTPTIKAYDEKAWAELPDVTGPPELSLDLLDGLHRRWVTLLRRLQPADFARAFVHPETGDRVQLGLNVGIYGWHGRHHLAHVTQLAHREGWDIGEGVASD